jgi:hypothetical protein
VGLATLPIREVLNKLGDMLDLLIEGHLFLVSILQRDRECIVQIVELSEA